MKKPTQSNPIRIIKKSDCTKLSTKAKGTLTNHIGYNDTISSAFWKIYPERS
jgi:hypothetical protein